MSEQLSLFGVEDSKSVSSTESVEDTQTAKFRAIQRYLNNADKEAIACVGTYSPNGRKSSYYRLAYRAGRKVKCVHIPGGNTRSNLATYRAEQLQIMIDRGAGIEELLSAIVDYRGGSK